MALWLDVLDQDGNDRLVHVVGHRQLFLELLGRIAFVRKQDDQHIRRDQVSANSIAPIDTGFDLLVPPDADAARFQRFDQITCNRLICAAIA